MLSSYNLWHFYQSNQIKQTFKKSCCLAFVHFYPIKSLAKGTSCLFVLHHIFLQGVRELRGEIPGHCEVLFIHLEVQSLLIFLFTLVGESYLLLLLI